MVKIKTDTGSSRFRCSSFSYVIGDLHPSVEWRWMELESWIADIDAFYSALQPRYIIS